MDASKRLVNLFFAASTLIAWFIFAKLLASVFVMVGMRDHHLLGKQFTSSTLIGALAAVAALMWTWRHVRFRPLVNEVADELVKVTWPSWEETRNQTRITIVVSIVVALILWVFDQVFGNLTALILGG
ncbi:MAG: preprotein translocase subunit SecE [Myxococcales bacterium]|nr:preprotein translocase subunit SecE [Myxococcales bacterium]MCB9547434.1 preprotein translocase subunit SecE [Myxococcales bacterium]